jgi:predicted nucleotidyltransferase
MTSLTAIDFSQYQVQIADFCERHHIRKLSIFGSVLRSDFTTESDIDFLVEFDPNCVPGLISLAGMELELSKLLQRKVDIRTVNDLSPYFRQKVLDSAVVQHVCH